MAKPIITLISPFDADITDYTVEFSYSGNQSYGSIMTVYDASTFSVVYTNNTYTDRNMRCENYIPKGTLSNGTGSPMKYCVTIVSVDQYGTQSAVSDPVYFWCLTTPVLKFAVPDGNDTVTTIENSNVGVRVEYSQEQFDEIYQIQFFLYNSAGNVEQESDIRYDGGDENLSYTFAGLDNGENYYVEAVVLTQTGMTVTAQKKLFITYQQPSTYSRVYATSDNEDGIVDWYTNIVAIEPTRPKGEYDFSDDGYIDLREDWITYKSNFVIEGDFILGFIHRFEKTNVILMDNDVFKLELLDTGASTYVYKLTAYGALSDYILYSAPLSGVEYHDDVVVYVRRVNNVYELHTEVVFGGTSIFTSYNLWLGRQPSYSSMSNYDAWIELADISSSTQIPNVSANMIVEDTEPTGTTDYGTIWLGGINT